MLEGIGDYTAKRIDAKLKEYHASRQVEAGRPSTSTIHEYRPAYSAGMGSAYDAARVDDDRNPLVEDALSIGRAYVPRYRSGGYALLLTLFEENCTEQTGLFLAKQELIKKAQAHCDSSFTVPDQHQYITAWGSMKTLTTKGLVFQEGLRPAKYRLTEPGRRLALTLASATARPIASITPSSSSTSGRNSDLTGSRVPSVPTPTGASSQSTQLKSIASEIVCIDLDDDEPELGSQPTTIQLSSSDEEALPPSMPTTRSSYNDETSASASSLAGGKTTSQPLIRKQTRPDIAQWDALIEKHLSSWDALAELGLPQAPQPAVVSRGAMVGAAAASPPAVYLRNESIKFAAGSFEVLLLLDNREIRSQKDRAFIQQRMSEAGISHVTRALEVGDFLWVARRRRDQEG